MFFATVGQAFSTFVIMASCGISEQNTETESDSSLLRKDSEEDAEPPGDRRWRQNVIGRNKVKCCSAFMRSTKEIRFYKEFFSG